MPAPRTALTTLRARLADKHLGLWVPGYLRGLVASRALDALTTPRGPRHLFVAVCDHFEPRWRSASRAQADDRARRWRDEFPALAACYRDSEGRPPRHTFFVPGEEIEPSQLDALAPLCRDGLAEIELHLHHDGDDADSLRRALDAHVTMLADEGHLARAPDGRPRFAFVHGNWALANARPDGRHCGVDEELRVLFASGCYADFTFPAYPDPSQPRVVNRIYWPDVERRERRAADGGEPARVGRFREDRLLCVQGPLTVARRPGTWRPRVEYAALTAHDPATPARLASWLAANVHVAGKPEWRFVKLHTHGAPERQAESLLGEGGRALHEALAALVRQGDYRLHYVTARELYNVATAAMLGVLGEPSGLRDHLLGPPPIAAHGT